MKSLNTLFLFLIYFLGIILWLSFFYLVQPDHLDIYFESPMKYHYGYDGDFNNFKNLMLQIKPFIEASGKTLATQGAIAHV